MADTITRAEQYTANPDTDLYVSGLAEDDLGNNPFEQNADVEDRPATDPDAVAMAALLSRKEDAEDGVGKEGEPQQGTASTGGVHIVGEKEQAVGRGSEKTGDDANGSRTNGAFKEGRPASTAEAAVREPETGAETDQTKTNADEPRGQRRSSVKRPQGTLMDTVSGSNLNNLDPEVEHLAKRARRDSRVLVVQPGDNAEEEDAKMRANLLQHGIVPKDNGEKNEKEEDAVSVVAGDDADHPIEVEALPLMNQLSEKKRRDSVPRDVGDDDDDVEAKRDDDYDPGNYARFEDDDDGDAGEDTANDGGEGGEGLVFDEEELVPDPGADAAGVR